MIAGAPPFLIFAAGALALLFIPERWRPAWTLFTPLAGLVNLLALESGVHWRVGILDYELVFGRIDKLSLLFALLFHIAAALGAIFALHVRDTVQQASALLYAAGALGAVFAGDLLSLFVFWETMAVASVFLVWAGGTERATRAGLRYLAAQVASGVLLLAGALIHHGETGSLEFAALSLDGLGAKLIFLAFGVKCAWPFLHSWLTDAYPEATPTGTVFLSAFTTKVAVYALARSFAGTEILIWIGAAMAMFPIFYAVIENDLRRVLAYSLINQVGFMVVGVGLGTALALNGAVSHAFNDVVFKGLLFMSMGAVLHMTGPDRRHRPRRALQDDAVDDGVLPGRRSVDLRLPAVFRVRLQVDGDDVGSGGRLCVRLPVPVVRQRRRLPPCRHQDPLFRVLRARFGHPDLRPAAQHAGGDGHCRGDLRLQWRVSVGVV